MARRGHTTCSRCTLERKLSEYDAKSLKRLLLHDELHNAVCLFCDSSSLRGQSWESHSCSKCEKNLPWSAFSIETRRSRNPRKWRCEECQRPLCTKCGQRPNKPLTYDVEDTEDFICQPCLYPPCSFGRGNIRRAE